MIWIIGNKGMLGQEVTSLCKIKGLSFVGTDREVSILKKKDLEAFYHKNDEINFIINCSAYTAVDKAESEKEVAYAINQTGVRNIAELASEKDIPLVHVSTDYVFAGTSSVPLNEEEPTNPVSVYGASKRAGEEEIEKICSKYFIVRTAWLYGSNGPNFVYTMLKLMNKLDAIKVVDDQQGSPTCAEELAKLLVHIIETESKEYGIYHYSGSGECSWYEFAKEIYNKGTKKGLIESECSVIPCSSDQYPTAAKRPTYSLLSKEKVKNKLNFPIVPWKESLEYFLEKIDLNCSYLK